MNSLTRQSIVVSLSTDCSLLELVHVSATIDVKMLACPFVPVLRWLTRVQFMALPMLFVFSFIDCDYRRRNHLVYLVIHWRGENCDSLSLMHGHALRIRRSLWQLTGEYFKENIVVTKERIESKFTITRTAKCWAWDSQIRKQILYWTDRRIEIWSWLPWCREWIWWLEDSK